jgi:hypothetical protein
MKLKVNHFAAKNLNLAATFGLEAMLTEVFVGFLSGFFAYIGYSSKLPSLFFLCSIVTFACVISFSRSLQDYLQLKRDIKASQAELDSKTNTQEESN